MGPVGVEQRGRRGAVGQAEGVSRRPIRAPPSARPARRRRCPAWPWPRPRHRGSRSASGGWRRTRTSLRGHDIACRRRGPASAPRRPAAGIVGNQPDRTRMVRLQVLDDRGRLHDRAAVVDQQRETPGSARGSRTSRRSPRRRAKACGSRRGCRSHRRRSAPSGSRTRTGARRAAASSDDSPGRYESLPWRMAREAFESRDETSIRKQKAIYSLAPRHVGGLHSRASAHPRGYGGSRPSVFAGRRAAYEAVAAKRARTSSTRPRRPDDASPERHRQRQGNHQAYAKRQAGTAPPRKRLHEDEI